MNKIDIHPALLDNGVDVFVDGERVSLEASLTIREHSPTGFNVGYSGSGPAQCALGILLHVTGDPRVASHLHQRFKEEFVSQWEVGNTYEVDVKGWCGLAQCPRCRLPRLYTGDNVALNALSRTDNETYICSDCGEEEALIDEGLIPRSPGVELRNMLLSLHILAKNNE